jgi:acetamidase/formamidase family protein
VRHRERVLGRIDSGDTVIVGTRDISDNQVARDSGESTAAAFDSDRSYPLTGPIDVHGAEADDTLKIEISMLTRRDADGPGSFRGFGAAVIEVMTERPVDPSRDHALPDQGLHALGDTHRALRPRRRTGAGDEEEPAGAGARLARAFHGRRVRTDRCRRRWRSTISEFLWRPAAKYMRVQLSMRLSTV